MSKQTQEPGGPERALPCTMTLRRPRSVLVLVVGAGGTGARFAVVAAKMLRRGDEIVFIDPDTVEERNLARQHFVGRDVGRPKAEVLGRRLAAEAARVGYGVQALPVPWNDAPVGALEREALKRAETPGLAWAGTEADRYPLGVVVVGCVDNKAVRAEIAKWLGSLRSPSLWLDAGNELRAGQVLLTTTNWPVWEIRNEQLKLVVTSRETAAAAGVREHQAAPTVQVAGLPTLYPRLLEAEAPPAAGPGCEDVPDLQSVTANNLAAAYLGTMLSWVLDEIPCTMAGMAFSQLGTVQTFPLKTITPKPRTTEWVAGL